MGRTPKDLNYLKSIKPIKEYLRDTPLSDKKIKNSLLATEKVFPYLVNRFKDGIEELKDFDLQTFLSKSTEDVNKITQRWVKNNLHNRIFDSWKKESPETKSNILMKWVKFSLEQEAKKPETQKRTKENSFLSYMWTFQGLLAYLGRDYEANPKKLDQLKQNDIKLGSEISYNDVIELYDKLNQKYKIILRIMMYSGLNPIDILKLTPKNFQKVNGSIRKKLNDKESDFYYVIKERTKTERKNVLFLLVFSENFLNEIKSFFEREITINISKDKTEKINSIKNENYIVDSKEVNRFTIDNEAIKSKDAKTVRFHGQYHWDYDSNVSIFRSITNTTTVADNFKTMVDKHGLNEFLKPYQIRSLCFTMLKDQFTFKDENLYQLWTQHRVKGLVDRNYITNNLTTLINKYLPKIEATVLIGSLKDTLEKAIEYKEKAEAINDNTEKIDELNLENNRLLTKLNATNDKITDLTNIIKGLGVFIQEDFERLNDDITADYKDKVDSEYFKSRHKLLDNLNKRIDKLGLKE